MLHCRFFGSFFRENALTRPARIRSGSVFRLVADRNQSLFLSTSIPNPASVRPEGSQVQVQHSDPNATLCMPGCPPRHVCVAERRLLLTYLLTKDHRSRNLLQSGPPLSPESDVHGHQTSPRSRISASSFRVRFIIHGTLHHSWHASSCT
jgi:hypothetical protein